MAQDNIQIIISAKDDASKELDSVGSGLKKLGGVASAAGVAIGGAFVAAGAAAFKFGKDSLRAFTNAEKEMAVANLSLENTLKSMTESQLENATGFIDLSGALGEMKFAMDEVGVSAAKLGIDDEAASVSFAKLFSVSKDVSIAMNDLKLAQDLAAFSGRDLESATQAVIMVHAGGTRILKEFGLEVDSNITSQEALALVQDKVAGSAQVMADTTAGKMAILSVAWENLQETAGAALAEAITPFITQLSEWVQSDQTQETIMQITEQIVNLTKQLGPFISAVLPALLEIMKGILFTIQMVSSGFLQFADFLGTVIFKVMELTEWFGKMISKAGDAIKKLKEFTTESSVGKAIGAIGGLVSSSVGAISKALPKFENGGFVNAPVGMAVPAIVHGGETIIPSGKSMGGITINISGNSFLDKDAPRKMADSLINALKLQVRI